MDEMWWRRGGCRGREDLFVGGRAAAKAEARHVCFKHCPVMAECIEQTHADVAAGVPPVAMVMAGVSWNAAGKVSRQQGMDPSCSLCQPWRKGVVG